MLLQLFPYLPSVIESLEILPSQQLLQNSVPCKLHTLQGNHYLHEEIGGFRRFALLREYLQQYFEHLQNQACFQLKLNQIILQAWLFFEVLFLLQCKLV